MRLEYYVICFLGSLEIFSVAQRVSIAFVYDLVPAVCGDGLPEYIHDVLIQARTTQWDCDIVFASNFDRCPKIREITSKIANLREYDIDANLSDRTKLFKTRAENLFEKDGKGELWMTSAYRFFYLEDMMRKFNFVELLHVEGDNMLYGKISSVIPFFRRSYNALAATPATARVSTITASVLWINSLQSLARLNDMLLELSLQQREWKRYLAYLRVYFCCKRQGGLDRDANGNGIFSHAVNEMTMLAYYRYAFPEKFKLLPVLPSRHYTHYKYIIDLNKFTANGAETGGLTGAGIWDPGSWGQYLGGIVGPDSSKGFSDPMHICGQAMRVRNCRPAMLCANSSWFYNNATASKYDAKRCWTAPFVRCLEGQAGDERWTPLWNLHIHSKHTLEFRSMPCECSDSAS